MSESDKSSEEEIEEILRQVGEEVTDAMTAAAERVTLPPFKEMDEQSTETLLTNCIGAIADLRAGILLTTTFAAIAKTFGMPEDELNLIQDGTDELLARAAGSIRMLAIRIDTGCGRIKVGDDETGAR